MLTPASLKAGDKVAIVSTARKVDHADLRVAIKMLQDWGLIPVLGKSIDASQDQYAGSDDLRRHDLQTMLDDEAVRAIWCARGGYGTVRIIDGLDFSKFIKHPKWIVGYSDVTVLHARLHKMGVETLHAPMAQGIVNVTAFAKAGLEHSLFGKGIRYKIHGHSLNRNGTANGLVVGGNLSILYSLCGSPTALNTNGKILFIEDLDEYLYHIDRMMMNLKRNGMLRHLAALIVGGMTEMNDNSVPFGKNAEEIVLEAVREYDYPVCFDFPAGHIADNRALILGRKVELSVDKNGVKLHFLS